MSLGYRLLLIITQDNMKGSNLIACCYFFKIFWQKKNEILCYPRNILRVCVCACARTSVCVCSMKLQCQTQDIERGFHITSTFENTHTRTRTHTHAHEHTHTHTHTSTHTHKMRAHAPHDKCFPASTAGEGEAKNSVFNIHPLVSCSLPRTCYRV